MKTIYEPYKTDSFLKLLKHAYNLGWYGGEKNLFTLKCNGKFEGYSGRASETWEHQFILTSEAIQTDSGQVIPALNIKGKTIEEVCNEAIKVLEQS